MNVMTPDCGWNPDLRNEFKDVTAEQVGDATAWDLSGIVNARLTYASGTVSAVTITDFVNMVDGRHYKLLVKNASNTALGVTFPSDAVTESIDISVKDSTTSDCTVAQKAISNGDYVLYDFWTDGQVIFVKRSLYS